MEEKKKLRHFLLVPPVMTYVLMIVGALIGYVLYIICTRKVTDSAWLFIFESYGVFIGIWISTLIYLAIFEKDILKNVFNGLKGNNFKMLMIGNALGFAMNMICALVAMLHKDIALSFSGFDIPYLLVAAILVFIQSSAEELLCRGYLYMALKKRYGVILAALINSVFFAVTHLSNDGISWIALAEIFIIGICCTIAVEGHDSLWMAFAIHASWNYTQNIILGLPNSGLVSEKAIMHLDAAGSSIFYDKVFGLEGGITSAIVCVIVSVVLYLLAKKKKEA
ncbi:MAG: CPBP family intramembrane metalloprotease [Erysipelotrichaceae bacterium]|nr:CPBP family intramembrane metalloprotease [Erysipelotrichaceae bacterium]